jgi:uncharacterized protein YdcH (DUF465 family)
MKRDLSRDYPPSPIPNRVTRRGNLIWEELPNMERNAQEELRAHLMSTSEEYQRLATQHSEFAKQLDALEALPHLTQDQELEETRIKKLKLRLKDQMEAIVSQYRSQQVA